MSEFYEGNGGSSANQPTVSYDGTGDIPDDPRIVEVVQAYLAELERGFQPNRTVFLERYPELAEVIARCLDGLEMVHHGLNSTSGRSAVANVAALGNERLPDALGDFQIVRELARGGMGIVYEAQQLSLARRVALKVLPFTATFDSRQLQRFKNEAQAAALLHHTNIVPIYAVGCERGVHFYAMQLIDGQSLAEIIKQLRHQQRGHTSEYRLPDSDSSRANVLTSAATQRSPSFQSTLNLSTVVTAGASPGSEHYFRRIAALILQAAEGLEHAHQQGVVHRDIKPANLLVNAAGNLWITDFGLAQFQTDTGLTRSGDVLGTIRYMSPEQTSGRRTVLDHRTDIYSLGATFYELLTLDPVFDGETRQELLFSILHQEPRAPRTINRAVPPELETIVLKSLSKLPADRYATAADLAADIRRYLDHQPIHAKRPTVVERARKWSRRHPSIVIASVITLAVIAVASWISTWLISHEQKQTEAALDREAHRADEAEQRFRQAREAVDVLIRVSEEELADKPLQGTRKRLLQIALDYYRDFIEQRRGDPAARAELEAVQKRVMQILHELEVLQREMHVFLLDNDDVKADLNLSPEQIGKLESLIPQWWSERAAAFEETRFLDEEARRRRFAMAETREETLEKLLQPEQRERLKQIAIQIHGLFAFKEPEIIDALELTPQQIANIREIERETFAGAPHGPREPGRPWRPNLSRLESVQKILAILNEEQRARWQGLTGRPFAALDDPNFPGPFKGTRGSSPPRSREP